jgi:hypothetical protein
VEFKLSTVFLVFTASLFSEVTIAFWDFNDGYAVDNDTPQITHSASFGSGTLYQQRADTDGNGKSGNAFSQFGISSSAGKSMAWDDIGKSGDNDAEFFITFSTVGFKDIELYFDILGNEDAGVASFDLKYGFNGLEDSTPADVSGPVKDFTSGESTSLINNELFPTSINGLERTFAQSSVNFVGLLDNQNTIAIRLDDFDNNDAMSIDNVLIVGTAIPEPSTYSLLLGSVFLAFALFRSCKL